MSFELDVQDVNKNILRRPSSAEPRSSNSVGSMGKKIEKADKAEDTFAKMPFHPSDNSLRKLSALEGSLRLLKTPEGY